MRGVKLWMDLPEGLRASIHTLPFLFLLERCAKAGTEHLSRGHYRTTGIWLRLLARNILPHPITVYVQMQNTSRKARECHLHFHLVGGYALAAHIADCATTLTAPTAPVGGRSG
jgi:hypothetical protein